MIENNWKRVNEVWIPPIEKLGFEGDVLNRPFLKKKVHKVEEIRKVEEVEKEEMTVSLHSMDEEKTVVIRVPEEEATVLLNTPVSFQAYVERKKNGEKVCLEKECWIIGKKTTSDYVIADNATISRQHASISKKEDGYYLEDLGSSNHTFVNGEEINEPIRLSDGMSFVLADEEFVFTIQKMQHK